MGFHSESVAIPLDRDASLNEKENENENEDDASRRWIVDVPMRGFQGGYYPLLLSLYRHLSLPLVETKYTYSFTSASKGTYFTYSGASGLSIPSLPSSCFSSPAAILSGVAAFLGVALSYLLLLVLSFLAWHGFLPSTLRDPELTLRKFTTTLSTFLARPLSIPLTSFAPRTPLGDIFESFIATIVLPLFSAVGTMTSADVWSTPVRVILEYIHTTLGTAHYHLGSGLSAGNVARLLAEPVRAQGEGHVRLHANIEEIEYGFAGELSIKLRSEEGAEPESLRVDKVVVATQASSARRLLEGLQGSLKERGEEKERRRIEVMKRALGDVGYRETIVITHRDSSVLPIRPDRKDINLFLSTPCSSSSSSSSLSDTNLGPRIAIHDDSSLPPYPLSQSEPAETPFFDSTLHGLYAMATQIISPPLGSQLPPILQTTNPVVPIDSKKVLSVSRLERALPLRHPSPTLSALRPSYPNPNALIYLAGSYAYPGIPLLEGCVGSAKLVVEEIIGRSDRAAAAGWVSLSKIGRESVGSIGGVDWDKGRGGLVMRIWRWRWHKGQR